MPQITYHEFVHLREWIHDKGIGVVLAIEIRLDKVQDTVVSEGAPFDIDNDLESDKNQTGNSQLLVTYNGQVCLRTSQMERLDNLLLSRRVSRFPSA